MRFMHTEKSFQEIRNILIAGHNFLVPRYGSAHGTPSLLGARGTGCDIGHLESNVTNAFS